MMPLNLLITMSWFYSVSSLVVTEMDSNADAQPWKTGVEELSQTWPPANLFPPSRPKNNTAVDTGKERRFITRGLIWELTVSPCLQTHKWKLQLIFIIYGWITPDWRLGRCGCGCSRIEPRQSGAQ